MHHDNPHYMFGECTPPSLIRHFREGRYVSGEEIAAVLDQFPEAIEIEEIREIVEKADRGELRGPAGRPRRKMVDYLQHLLASFEVARLLDLYSRAARRNSPHAYHCERGQPGLSRFIHERVARKMKTGGGRSKTYELINSKQLETVKIGRRRLVSIKSIMAFADLLQQSSAD